MTIRLFRESDYSGAAALWTRTPGMGMRAMDDSPEGIARFLRRNPASCFVAEEDGALVGAILGGHDGRRGFIYHACVDEAYRGAGLGRRLTERVLAAFEAEGIHKAALVCMTGNEAGNAFWKCLGWNRRSDLNYYDMEIHPDFR